MTQSEFLIHFSWLIALLVAVAASSWVVLLLQAVFADKRIALTGLFGSLLVAFLAVAVLAFPALVTAIKVLKWAAVLICGVFLLWFLLTNYKRPVVFIPAIGLTLCLLVGYRLYQAYLLAT